MPKVWGYVTIAAGNPTVAASYNVSSVTHTTGTLTVNIAVPFSSANYNVNGSAISVTGGGVPDISTSVDTTATQTAGTFVIRCSRSGALANPFAYNFVCFGDQ